MIWQVVTALLRRNIAVNSLGVPDSKSILERTGGIGVNGALLVRKMESQLMVEIV